MTEEERVVREYFEAQARWDADALPGIVSKDFTLGPFKSCAELQEAWRDPYDHLEEDMVVESVELEGLKPVVRWRSELRWRHDGSLAATQTVVTRHTVVGGRITAIQLVESSGWQRT